MKKMNFEQAVNYCDNENLSIKELTYGSNGYPSFSGEKRFAYFGFEDFASAEVLAKEVGGQIEKIHFKDGWQLAESNGTAYEPFYNSAEDYGENYSEWSCPDQEFEFLKEAISQCDDIDSITSLIDNYKECDDAYDTCGDDYFVLTNGGVYNDTVARKSMDWCYDTHNYHIAVVINSSQYSEDE